jgi:hypothetical protein
MLAIAEVRAEAASRDDRASVVPRRLFPIAPQGDGDGGRGADELGPPAPSPSFGAVYG